MITSNETIVHRCALTCIPHVSRVHVVQSIHLEYYIQPSTLHVKQVFPICFGGRRCTLPPQSLPPAFFHYLYKFKLAHFSIHQFDSTIFIFIFIYLFLYLYIYFLYIFMYLPPNPPPPAFFNYLNSNLHTFQYTCLIRLY